VSTRTGHSPRGVRTAPYDRSCRLPFDKRPARSSAPDNSPGHASPRRSTLPSAGSALPRITWLLLMLSVPVTASSNSSPISGEANFHAAPVWPPIGTRRTQSNRGRSVGLSGRPSPQARRRRADDAAHSAEAPNDQASVARLADPDQRVQPRLEQVGELITERSVHAQIGIPCSQPVERGRDAQSAERRWQPNPERFRRRTRALAHHALGLVRRDEDADARAEELSSVVRKTEQSCAAAGGLPADLPTGRSMRHGWRCA